MTAVIPEIPSCPPSGNGVHLWCMEAAWACRRLGLSEDEAVRALHERMSRRPDPADEIEAAVGKVFNSPPLVIDRANRRRRIDDWPARDPEEINTVVDCSGGGVESLRAASPVKFEDGRPHTADILPVLFPGDPLVCAGSKFDFFTRRLSEFVGIAHQLEQVVPSPMIAVWGRTRTGKPSQHSLEATGARRFLIIEGDGTSKDEQAAVLMFLARCAPLALVVDSGGKSLHGWFFTNGRSDERIAPFFRRACELGADRGLWTRNQFARMPDGTRDNGQRQSVLFFDPEVCR